MNPSGLLFVLGECGSHVREEDFNDWYDNEHVPARLTVPGFHSATRYKAADDTKPSWLAIYEMESSSTVYTDAYKGLSASSSIRERSIIANLATLNRSIFTNIISLTKPGVDTDTLPGKYMLVVSWVVQPELEEEFIKWYDEEHLAEVSKSSGWLRGRVFKLEANAELAGKATLASKTPPNYLVIYDYTNDGYLSTQDFQAAIKTGIKTPWSEKILSSVERVEIRRFMLYNDFKQSSSKVD